MQVLRLYKRVFVGSLVIFLFCFSISYAAEKSGSENREAEAIEAFQNFPVLGVNRTAEVFKMERASDEQIRELQNYKVLLIPGFLSDFAPYFRNSAVGKRIGFRGQFTDHIAAFVDWGIDYELLEIESEDPPEKNAARLRDFLETSPEKYILLTHSKGSIDAMDAFLRYPEIRSRIVMWLSMQAPFWGTPVAEFFLDKECLDEPLKRIMKFLGGSIESIYSMSFFERSPYMYEHSVEIGDLISEIPTLSVSTTKPDVKWNWDTRFEPYFRDYLWKRGLENDGLIPWQSAVLPGTNYVKIEGLDHFWTFSNELSKKIGGKDLVQNMLKMLMELPKAKNQI